jgi:predicted Fe-Mo cluster-binding NifX family protein
MKIALCSKENKKESLVDDRFARSEYFVIFDDEKKDFNFIKNNSNTEHGAGPKAIQFLAEQNVNIIIAPPLGKNATMAAEGSQMQVYLQENKSIEENLKAFKENLLNKQ